MQRQRQPDELTPNVEGTQFQQVVILEEIQEGGVKVQMLLNFPSLTPDGIQKPNPSVEVRKTLPIGIPPDASTGIWEQEFTHIVRSKNPTAHNLATMWNHMAVENVTQKSMTIKLREVLNGAGFLTIPTSNLLR